MLIEYTHEEYKKLYEKLPKDFQKFFWDEDIAIYIEKIRERHGLENIEGNKISLIVAHIFLGITEAEKLEEIIIEEIEPNREKAKKIAREINRFIVSPARPFLEQLYGKKEKKITSVFESEKEREGLGDTYREPIE